MNLQLAEKVITEVVQLGVHEFCLCAGARNSPLVVLLEKAKGIRVHSFFEERSASFFALGRTKKTGRPVAIVTTSGTAVAELLPAAVEATYTGQPLLFITADRPRDYRGKGAPQCRNDRHARGLSAPRGRHRADGGGDGGQDRAHDRRGRCPHQ